VLKKPGWPEGASAVVKTARDVLAVATAGAAPEIQEAVARFARAQPVADEARNDEIHGAWVRTQSEIFERFIAEQGRQPTSPALEALLALVSGNLRRYQALADQDDSFQGAFVASGLSVEDIVEATERTGVILGEVPDDVDFG
jgi:hypothetical protein